MPFGLTPPRSIETSHSRKYTLTLLVNTVTSRHGTLARLFTTHTTHRTRNTPRTERGLSKALREREREQTTTDQQLKKTGNEQTEADKHTNTNNGNKQRQTAERVGRKALGQLNERLPLRYSIDAHNDMQSNRYACRAYKQSQRSSQVRGEGNATAVRSYQRGEG